MVEQHGEKSARLKVFENTVCARLQKAAATSSWKAVEKVFWSLSVYRENNRDSKKQRWRLEC